MKKFLLMLVVAMASQLTFAQKAESVFTDFRDQKKAEYVNVPKVLMSVAAAKVKDGNAAALLKEVNSAKVLTLSQCGKGTRKKFAKRIMALDGDGYDRFTDMKDGKDNVTVLVKKDSDETIREIVTLIADEDDCIGILVTGKINPEDVAAIIGMVDD